MAKILKNTGIALAAVAAVGATVCWTIADQNALRGRIRDLNRRVLPVLDATGATHFVCFGTLLGAVREGDVIRGDGDGDVCVLSEDADKIVAARDVLSRDAGAVLETNVYVPRAKKGLNILMRIRDAQKPQAYIDVYVLDSEDIGTGLLGYSNWYGVDKGVTLPRLLALPPKRLDRKTEFGDSIWVPKDPEGILKHVYGPNWRVPRKGDKGLDHNGFLSDFWRVVSPHICDVRLGYMQIVYGK